MLTQPNQIISHIQIEQILKWKKSFPDWIRSDIYSIIYFDEKLKVFKNIIKNSQKFVSKNRFL